MIDRRTLLATATATATATAAAGVVAGPALARADGPVRIACARLTHGHVGWLLGREPIGDIELVGIYEPDAELAARHVRDFRLDPALIHADLGAMLDAVRPEAVAAFGAVSEHLSVVEAAAPRGVAVMVEKPLAFEAAVADRIAALAARHRTPVLTNYETTWYPSGHALQAALAGGAIGAIRRVVFRDGHWGPKEIGVSPEFLSWLTDPAQNGGGALIDFGCYGANLMTWLMGNVAPTSVTAVTSRTKTDPAYAAVDDEATVVLTYPHAQAVIQASWNWPDHRKDMEVFGETGYLRAPTPDEVFQRRRGEAAEAAVPVPAMPAAHRDGFAYLAAVLRGRETLADTDRSSLANALIVARILDAARRSAATGHRVDLDAI